MMSLPTITMSDWLEAEQQAGLDHYGPRGPQPSNTVTPEQYAKLRNVTRAQSHRLLVALVDKEKATREKWNRGFVYRLIK